MRKIVLIIGIFIFLSNVISIGSEEANISRMTILYLCELQGQVIPLNDPKGVGTLGGIAKIGGLVKKIKEQNKEDGVITIFLVGGNALSGDVVPDLSKAEMIVDAFNSIGVDAMGIGEREFDFGKDGLLKLKERAHFPFLSSNIYLKQYGVSLLQPFVVKSIGTVKIGIIGISNAEIPKSTSSKNTEGLDFIEPISKVKENVLRLKDRCNFVLILSNLGSSVDKKMPETVKGISVILGGHRGVRMESPQVVKNTVIWQTGERGMYLGRLDIILENGKVKENFGQLLSVSGEIEEDKKISELVGNYFKGRDVEIKKGIATSKVELIGDSKSLNSGETNYGSLVADAIRSRAGVDIAIVNAGSIRSGLKSGSITLKDVMNSVQDVNLKTFEISGQKLLDAFSLSVSKKCGEGGFLQVSGVYLEVSLGTLKEILVLGKPLEPGRIYRVVTVSSLLKGDTVYKMLLQGKNYKDIGVSFQEAVVAYLSEMRIIDGGGKKRIVMR